MKRMNSTSFQVLENQKTSKSFWYKEEEEVQRDSKVVNEYVEKLFVKVVSIVCSSSNVNQGIAFIDSSSLVKKTVGRL